MEEDMEEEKQFFEVGDKVAIVGYRLLSITTVEKVGRRIVTTKDGGKYNLKGRVWGGTGLEKRHLEHLKPCHLKERHQINLEVEMHQLSDFIAKKGMDSDSVQRLREAISPFIKAMKNKQDA